MNTEADNSPRYAPAAGLVSDTTIVTCSNGLTATHITIPHRDNMKVYVARPEGIDQLPIVLVLSEAFGLHEHIEDVARRFAHAGYMAIAPDLMFRQGDPMAFTDIGSLVSDLLLRIPDAQVMADLDACVEWAITNGGDQKKLSATGFCWGGRWTWLYAAHRAMYSAVVWYGIVDGKKSGIFPDTSEFFSRHPIDVTADLATPVLGLYGAMDEAIELHTIDAMKKRLADGSDAARQSRIIIYTEAGHAFFADYRNSYRADEAHDAWHRCLCWMVNPVAE